MTTPITHAPSTDAHTPTPDDREQRHNSRAAQLGKRLGAAAFLFFFIKGLVWIGVLAIGGKTILAGW